MGLFTFPSTLNLQTNKQKPRSLLLSESSSMCQRHLKHSVTHVGHEYPLGDAGFEKCLQIPYGCLLNIQIAYLPACLPVLRSLPPSHHPALLPSILPLLCFYVNVCVCKPTASGGCRVSSPMTLHLALLGRLSLNLTLVIILTALLELQVRARCLASRVTAAIQTLVHMITQQAFLTAEAFSGPSPPSPFPY